MSRFLLGIVLEDFSIYHLNTNVTPHFKNVKKIKYFNNFKNLY